ncbi:MULTISPECIES: hypothetical protein [unclassified Adlercreutzia]|uniref:hypothetical protein n=1 Tax=unclassified Adlercreutzia TaxID=2636013 RepID=UPI0013ECDA98|nr:MULTISPECIES: hypothetical protein [unclassified Adlercreutzia]
MSEIIYTESFLEDMLQVREKHIEDAIFEAIELLPFVPVLGSREVPAGLRRSFGAEARKISVAPFDVIYVPVNEDDFLVLGLVHQRAAR